MPSSADCRVDIEAFVEQYLGATLDVGAGLDDDVLGVTQFARGERPTILVNRDLTDAAFEVDEYSGTLGRWRATLAHEATHVMLHAMLFELNADQRTMFGDATAEPDRTCYKRDGSFGYRARDPREFQANKGMAGLLMPRAVFGEAARNLVDRTTPVELVERLAREFEVSRQATRIRLSALGFLGTDVTAGLFR
jgi:hypothetical protein